MKLFTLSLMAIFFAFITGCNAKHSEDGNYHALPYTGPEFKEYAIEDSFGHVKVFVLESGKEKFLVVYHNDGIAITKMSDKEESELR